MGTIELIEEIHFHLVVKSYIEQSKMTNFRFKPKYAPYLWLKI